MRRLIELVYVAGTFTSVIALSAGSLPPLKRWKDVMPASTAADSIDALLVVDVRALDTEALKRHLVGLAAARSRVAAAEARAVAEFDQRGSCVEDGMVNTPSWLAHHTGVPRAVAGGRVLLAKRLRRMPEMADALAEGSVTESHARALGRCLTPRRWPRSSATSRCWSQKPTRSMQTTSTTW